jgi:ABC-type oligopeptide transport system ATPase subunit
MNIKLSYLFIAHDLSFVKHISHKIAVIVFGKIVEMATSDELFLIQSILIQNLYCHRAKSLILQTKLKDKSSRRCSIAF